MDVCNLLKQTNGNTYYCTIKVLDLHLDSLKTLYLHLFGANTDSSYLFDIVNFIAQLLGARSECKPGAF
jgi:hypothetical protein